MLQVCENTTTTTFAKQNVCQAITPCIMFLHLAPVTNDTYHPRVAFNVLTSHALGAIVVVVIALYENDNDEQCMQACYSPSENAELQSCYSAALPIPRRESADMLHFWILYKLKLVKSSTYLSSCIRVFIPQDSMKDSYLFV